MFARVDYIHMDHMILVPIVMLVVMLVFYFNFRSFRGVWLPLVCLGMAEAWVLGIMGYLGFRITIMGSSLPPLMIANWQLLCHPHSESVLQRL